MRGKQKEKLDKPKQGNNFTHRSCQYEKLDTMFDPQKSRNKQRLWCLIETAFECRERVQM